MRFSIGWLKDYLEFESSTEELCEKLTQIGLEVENIFDVKQNLKDFVVVKVNEKEPHPNADKLSLCEVYDGKNNIRIVCGAANVRKNLITVLAPIGTIIKPGTDDEFKIGKSKIRGEESFGMLCSQEELGLSESSEGIIELNENYKIGEKFERYFGNENIVIEIGITPNRVDCAGVYGIARDLNAAGFGKLKKIEIPKIKESFDTPIKLVNELKRSVCPKFSLRLIKDVENLQSPSKIIERFNFSGIKVISSLVDITNYLTSDYCRPLHVFDFDKIKGDVTIRYSKKGENFFGLDGENYILEENMIVICDDSGIISLAGILGGNSTAVDENTKNVLIESAYFLPESISSSGRKLNIQSDARYRFERGVDPESVIDGLDIASNMIVKICGGEVGTIISDSLPVEDSREIKIEKSFFEEILGLEILTDFVKNVLEKIGCELKEEDNLLFVKPPSWRSDLNIKEDLTEEVARLYGYEKIPSKNLTFSDQKVLGKTNDVQKLRNKIKRVLVSRNIFEVVTWSFSDENTERIFNSSEELLQLKNPISVDLSCMRRNLLGNLIHIIKKNNNKNLSTISIFEIGPTFFGMSPGDQYENVCVVRSGNFSEKNWLEKDRSFDLFDIKADLIATLKSMNLNIEKLKFSDTQKSYYHPGKSASLLIGKEIVGSFGELNPSVLDKFDLKNNLVSFEINISKVLKYYKKKEDSKPEFRFSPYQLSVRDFSFIVNSNVLSSEIIASVRNIDNNLIKKVKIFDNFVGEKIGPNNRALGFEVTIQSDTKTLTEDEINSLSENIISEVENKYKAKLR